MMTERRMMERYALAEQLIRQAGILVRDGFHQAKQVGRKGAIDLVTQFDLQSEALILDGIRAHFPLDAFLAEEAGGQGNGALRWLIDPLDGTVNYAHGVPIFSVSIALYEDNQARFGLIYDPLREELFSARAGQGAFLNDERVHVSAATNLHESLLVTGFAYDVHTNPDNNFDEFAAFHMHTQGVRRLGSAALDLAYVACGRLDGYWELQIEAWDVAAGVLLVREAGGLVTRVDGSPDVLASPASVLAANPTLHADMAALLMDRKTQKA
jgi:myo-inositol-1(or 4)-monophosphatase